MKRERFVSGLWAVSLALTAAIGGAGCVISGFGLTGVHWGTLLLGWGLAAVVFALCFTYRRGLYPLIGLALLGGYLWQKGPLSQSLERLLWEISTVYNGAYGWGILRWSDNRLGSDTTTALCWIGLLVVICVVRCIVSRRSVFPAALATAVPLITCMVVTDTVPGEIWLYLLLFSIVILLLSHTVRRRDIAQGNRLTRLLALPTAAALALLFLLIPKEGYNGQTGAARLEALVLDVFSQAELPEIPQGSSPITDIGGHLAEDVNLRNVGPKSESMGRVMAVTAPHSGTLYLRGYSYDSYDGISWVSNEGRELESAWPREHTLSYNGHISISTIYTHNILYMPYYAADTQLYRDIRGGALENTERQLEYTIDWAYPTDLSDPAMGYSSEMEPYLRLPGSTAGWAEALAEQILGEPVPLASSAVTREKADAIAAFVRGSAQYDLSTERMPKDTEDFARWFLEESDTGYCVHFATTTAVLLRAAGIPARYVTGYMASVEAGQRTQVRNKDAHAWVEYRLPGGVWQVLESTPAGLSDTPIPTEGTLPQAPGTPSRPDQDPTQGTATPPPTPEQTRPVQGDDPEAPRPEAPKWLGKALSIVLSLAALIGVTIGQWRLRLRLQRKRQSSGKTNDRALAKWQLISRMAARLGKEPEDGLHELAQKAKFSQHTLTNAELAQFDEAITALCQALHLRGLLSRLADRLIYALY